VQPVLLSDSGGEWWTVLDADPAHEGAPRVRSCSAPRQGFLATTSRYSASMATVPSVARLNWSTSSSS
jgi:hypothetical protein